ncbi:ABC transporter ATP-binding protein [Candidatus Borkfalkia ceftriaxoniphila]|uniref:ABC transporter ATP-binding protein n=1 Tax=Candidatus Borkfalkia ceftriaxoniphila TaxID=2508949 RepID=A0A4V1QVE1_9FIRM|nr:ABC transporter ATP-binding protein [Candidatus Borkfalkia ceftriaxoniphila]RXZ62336.1 ABC transporter ATP-binding protein [Candidatus Borkfalkia ceftriaxoniphila]
MSNNRHRGPMGPGPAVAEKPKDFKKALGKLYGFIKPFIVPIIVALLFAVAGTVLNLIGPNKLGDLTNLIQASFDFDENSLQWILSDVNLQEVTSVCIFLVVIYSVGLLCSYLQGVIMATVTQKNSQGLRRAISKKINLLPLKYFDSNSVGDVLSRVTNDVDTIGQTLNQSLVTVFTAVVMLIGSVIMMFVTNAIMAVTAIVASLIGFVFMFLIMGKSQKYFMRQQRYLGDLNGHVEEVYSGHNVVKAYNAEKQVKAEFDSINRNLYSSAWKSQFLSGLMMPLMNFIGNLGYVAVCVVGAVLVSKGMSFGVVISFTLYVRLFTSPLSQLAQAFTSMQSAAAASERVFEFLGEKELSDEKDKKVQLLPENVKGEVAFEHVTFGYDEDRTIIHDFSAIAKAGQKVAIVGPTGAGKTTMVNLLMRFYEVNQGDIKIDGVPTDELTRANVHDLFGMVLQDTWLFEGTIRENVVYSKEGVSDEDVVRACKAVGLHHFIMTLPEGYDTVMSDKANLSAGQKQLVTIARAMVENAPMLILDEATSSVDTRTEVLIQRAMDKLTEGRTSFIIAHRLSTIKNADLILVMKDGDIIESGTHEELLAKKGFYADLYNSQFENAA